MTEKCSVLTTIVIHSMTGKKKKKVLPLNLLLNGSDWRQCKATRPNQISRRYFLRDYTITRELSDCLPPKNAANVTEWGIVGAGLHVSIHDGLLQQRGES